jgi:hypothetical protein
MSLSFDGRVAELLGRGVLSGLALLSLNGVTGTPVHTSGSLQHQSADHLLGLLAPIGDLGSQNEHDSENGENNAIDLGQRRYEMAALAAVALNSALRPITVEYGKALFVRGAKEGGLVALTIKGSRGVLLAEFNRPTSLQKAFQEATNFASTLQF